MVCRSCATGMPLECFRTMRTVTPGRVVTCSPFATGRVMCSQVRRQV